MNILTFDIEEWFVYGKYSHYGCSSVYLPRIDSLLDRILDLLEAENIHATFFCLGDVARNFPMVVKKIDQRGHHIGCHSDKHKFLGGMTPEEFDLDTNMALDSIENVIGKKVDAYRAPAFSVTERSSWALEILIDHGIKMDCSIFPGKHRFGGYPSYHEHKPSFLKCKSGSLKEFPIPLVNVFGKKFAFSGGGYFRLLPYFLSKQLVKRNDYVMCYFHIRDFDAEILKNISYSNVDMSFGHYFKNFYGINGAYDKFQLLIKDYEFVSLKQADAAIDWDKVSVFEP